MSTLIPWDSSTLITPTWAKPCVAPPPSARAIFGGGFIVGVTTGVTDFGGEAGTGGVGGGDGFSSGEVPHPAAVIRKENAKILAKMGISGQHT